MRNTNINIFIIKEKVFFRKMSICLHNLDLLQNATDQMFHILVGYRYPHSFSPSLKHTSNKTRGLPKT